MGLSVGLQSTIRRVPTGTPESENDPSAPTFVQWLFGTTSTSARIFEWMLQKISTGPGLSSTTGGDVSPPLTDPRSNELPGAVENTLWMTVSWLGNTSLVPSGTTVTRGANCLSRCLISTVWLRAVERRPSTYTYASPIGWPPLLLTRPLTVAVSRPPAALSLPASAPAGAPPLLAAAVGDGAGSGGSSDDGSAPAGALPACRNFSSTS